VNQLARAVILLHTQLRFYTNGIGYKKDREGDTVSEECLKNPEELVEFPIIDDRFTSNVAEASLLVMRLECFPLAIGGPLIKVIRIQEKAFY